MPGPERLSQIAVALALAAAPAWGTWPVTALRDGVGEYALGAALGILNDSDHPLTIDQVADPATEFSPSPGAEPRLGTGRSAWVRFAVVDSTAGGGDWLLEVALTYHESIALFLQSAEGGWEVARAGCLLPFTARQVPHRNHVLPLPTRPGVARVAYLHFEYEDQGVLAFPLTLWSREAFARYDHQSQVLLGLFYGLMIALTIYHAFLFVPLRDRSYLYYVLTLLAATLLFAFQNGFAAEYLWPGRGLGWSLPDLCTLGLLYIASGRFAQSFLLTSRNAPTLHRLLWTMVAVWAVLIAIGLAGYPGAFRPLARFSAASLALILAAGLTCWRRGFRPARYFLLGWVAPGAAGIALNLADIEVLSSWLPSMLAIQGGVAFGVVMFSLGLSDRINLLRREKEAHEHAARTAALEKRVLEQELNTAHQMQMGLMPAGQLAVAGIEVCGRCLPATQVGGDLFQYYESGGRVGCCIADVTGHAMEAAIPVVRFSGLLAGELQRFASVEELYSALNGALCRSLPRRSFVCFALVDVDVGSGRFRAGNAGCPHAYHYRRSADCLVEIELNAYPLGVRPGMVYPTAAGKLEPGDRIALCSDGIVEAASAGGEPLGYERLPDIVLRSCRVQGAQGVVDAILEETRRYTGGAWQADDMTCVVLCSS